MEVMKQLRHRAIRDLVSTRPIRTQQELAAALRDRGFRTTQATMSRDVAELGLIKAARDGTQAYAVPKRLVERLFGYVSLSYTFIGDPSGSDLRNSFGWSLGAAYTILVSLTVVAFLDGATAISPGQDDPLAARVGAEFRLTKALKLTGAVARGFTDGAADWDVAAGLALGF